MLLMTLMLSVAVVGDTTWDGRGVLQSMHDRYAATWYGALASVRSVTYFDSLGGLDHVEIWYESLSLPSTLRSDMAPLDRGRGELFRGDSVFRFEGDTVVQRQAGIHAVLLLGFGVYRQPVAATAEKLERFGFDLDSVAADTWEERPVWVVGRMGGPRFWVDGEQWLLRRLEMPGDPEGPGLEIRFSGYETVAGGWLATESVFLTNGVTRIREREVWWEAGVSFDARVFATVDRARPAWIRD